MKLMQLVHTGLACCALFLVVFISKFLFSRPVSNTQYRQTSRLSYTSALNTQSTETTLSQLRELFQRRIYKLQNPKDCSSAKLLFCNNRLTAGIGCLVSHSLPCFYLAYYLKRTVVLPLPQFEKSGGYERWFLPLSETCNFTSVDLTTSISIQTPRAIINATTLDNTIPILRWDVSYGPKWTWPFLHYLQAVVPEDLVELKNLVRHPTAWISGQFNYYLVGRLQPHVREYIEQQKMSLGYHHPILGLQVRKQTTDWRDNSIPWEQYMDEVERFSPKLQGEDGKNRIYLATDDINTIQFLPKSYPQYTIIYQDPRVAKTAITGHNSYKYDDFLLYGLIQDIHFIAEADFHVGTLNSNLGVMLYQLRLAIADKDRSDSSISVEETYNFISAFQFHYSETLLLVIKAYNSTRPQDLNISPGDLIDDPNLYYNWDKVIGLVSFSKGKVIGREVEGRYPVRHVVRYPDDVVRFPSFEDIDNGS